MNNDKPAFSGQPPQNSYFTSQNSIPSSATDDIVLKPDKTPKSGPKKGVIIAIIVAGVIFVVAALTILSLISSNSPSRGSSTNESSVDAPAVNPISLEEVQGSFYNLSNLLISGQPITTENQNMAAPNFSTPLNNWQFFKVSTFASAEQQFEYANALLEPLEIFSDYIQRYTSQNQDSATLEDDCAVLTDRLSVARVYLRGETFLNNLATIQQEDSEKAQSFVDGEIDLTGEVQDEVAFRLLSFITFYYNEYIAPDRNEDLLHSFAASANTSFDTLIDTLPTLLSSIDSTLKGLHE